MPKIQISPLALQDLHEISAYIADELVSPVAATHVIAQITKRIRVLEQFPEAGARLTAKLQTETNYRYLISGNHIVFYRHQAETIFVDRVLYSKRDYLKILFPSEEAPQ